MKNTHRAALATLLFPLLTGCVSGQKALPTAAQRSGCEPEKIEVVDQDGHELVLNVCGTHENWRWNALNGWEYVSMAAEQPLRGPLDADADGVPDGVDACPTKAGQATLATDTNGCPPPADQDGDGVADASDACPTVAGVTQADAGKSGCPLDSDADGIADANDACPGIAGVMNSDATRNGCPADQDGDGIVDDADACPTEMGEANAEDASRHGCAPQAEAPEVTTPAIP
jgi:Thrombospondin type 3 repeat